MSCPALPACDLQLFPFHLTTVPGDPSPCRRHGESSPLSFYAARSPFRLGRLLSGEYGTDDRDSDSEENTPLRRKQRVETEEKLPELPVNTVPTGLKLTAVK